MATESNNDARRVERRKVLAGGLAAGAFVPAVSGVGSVPRFAMASTFCEPVFGVWEEECPGASGTTTPIATSALSFSYSTPPAVGQESGPSLSSNQFDIIRVAVDTEYLAAAAGLTVPFDLELDIADTFCIDPEPVLISLTGSVDLSPLLAVAATFEAALEARPEFQNVVVSGGSLSGIYLVTSGSASVINTPSPFDLLDGGVVPVDATIEVDMGSPSVLGTECVIEPCPYKRCGAGGECPSPLEYLMMAQVTDLVIEFRTRYTVEMDYVGLSGSGTPREVRIIGDRYAWRPQLSVPLPQGLIDPTYVGSLSCAP